MMRQKGSQHLADMLSKCSALVCLNLCVNSIGDCNSMGDSWVGSLAAVLAQSKTLTVLNLSGNTVCYKALKHLNPCSNSIGRAGAQALTLTISTVSAWRGST